MAKKNTVTQEQVEAIIRGSKISSQTFFNKCLVVVVQLPNGFVLTESSGCVDPANYSVKIGFDNCMERIKNKIWELEGYLLQTNLTAKKAGEEIDW